MKILKNINIILTKKDKIKYIILLILIIGGALLEMFSITIVLPLIDMILNPQSIESNTILNNIYQKLNFYNINQFIVFISISIIILYILKNTYLVSIFYFQYRITYNCQAVFSKKLLNVYISKPYTFHLQNNSSEIVRNVNSEVLRAFKGILAFCQLITELFIVSAISIYLMVVEPSVVLIGGTIIGSAYLLVLRLIRPKITLYGKEFQQSNGEMIKWTNQSLEPIKEIKLYRIKDYFLNNFGREAKFYANARKKYLTLNQMPRLIIETVGVVAVFFVIIIAVINNYDLSQLIGVLAIFSLAAFKLLPSLNRISTYFNTVNFSLPALNIVSNDIVQHNLKQNAYLNTSKSKDILIKDKIEVNHLYFKYPNSDKYVINDVSINIPFGKSVALIGPSGCGKTTLMDILLEILKPDSGEIKVNNINILLNKKEWIGNIGYVPQNIYLIDNTIKANIAFGYQSHEIDDNKLWEVVNKSKLREVIEFLPDGIDTVIGERGIRLSGGQRQRIGIARALYKNPQLLIMDEATSSLDNDTENDIVSAINDLQGEITILVIAHRLSTIKNCDIVYEMNNGKIISFYNNKK